MLLQTVDSGDTAWILAGVCLVLIMTPGLALFYGGLLRKKNVLAMFALCFASMFLGSIAWMVVGYSISFGVDFAGFIGNPLEFIGLIGIWAAEPIGTIPLTVFIAFQCMFVIITAAILASPFAERAKFGSFMVLIFIWVIVVYSPIAHWVWGGGWLFQLGALDFAGGTVVHVNVGFSAFAIALVIGKRVDYQKYPQKPHNIPMVLTGLGLLWFGWFGFNGGSALAANEWAGLAIINTNIAACGGAVIWIILEYTDKSKGKPSLVGMATGVLAGLVAVTPAAGYVEPIFALIIGCIATVAIYKVLAWRTSSKLDETLDAFACHGVGGVTGAILTGVFSSVNGATSLITGDIGQLFIQILGVIVTAAFAFSMTFVIAIIIKRIMGLRVTKEEEYVGVDISQHYENAYS
jgi:Amt family ammonium transporter